MIDSVESQALTLLATLAAGAIVGVFFDLYRVARSVLRLGRLATAIADVCFWLFAASVVFAFLLAMCWGEVRFYVFVGFAVGFATYRAVLGQRVIGGAMSAYDLTRQARRHAVQGLREASFRARRSLETVRRGAHRARSRGRRAYAGFGALWARKKGSGK